MPARGQRAGFRLAVADDARDERIGIVEHRAERVAERIAELAALVDGPGVSGETWLGIPPGNENWRNSILGPPRPR